MDRRASAVGRNAETPGLLRLDTVPIPILLPVVTERRIADHATKESRRQHQDLIESQYFNLLQN